MTDLSPEGHAIWDYASARLAERLHVLRINGVCIECGEKYRQVVSVHAEHIIDSRLCSGCYMARLKATTGWKP